MQDMSDPADNDPGTAATAAAQQRTKTMLRSKSEGYNKGETTLKALVTFTGAMKHIT